MKNFSGAALRFSADQAEKIIIEHYGWQGSATPLESYADQNFRISDNSGREYVLKIANSRERRATLDMQNQAMAWLSERLSAGIGPEVIKNLQRESITEVEDAEGNSWLVRVLTFLPGTFLADYRPYPRELLKNWGEFLGRIDQALADFYHPAAEREMDWDLKNALHLLPDARFITAPRQRRLVEYFLLQFETLVVPRLPEFRRSIIHNDGNEYNLLTVSPNGQPRISGIIDFGDMVCTSTVFEPAIAAAYAMFGQDDPLAAAVELIGGYHAALPLRETEVELLYYLISTRLCISVIHSAREIQSAPENHYLTISEQYAWETLEKWLAINPQRAEEGFRQACKMPSRKPQTHLSKEEILRLRSVHLGKSLSVSYRRPLKIVKGAGQYLYDDTGRTYLDAVNNVPHVGHCHPRVVRAAQQQLAALNTNTRYLHENLVNYARRLSDTFPDPLTVCFLVNSGSEANDLALRMALTHTRGSEMIVVDGAYHGTTKSVIEISPYKFDGPGGSGAPAHVHKVPMPDDFRGPYRREEGQTGQRYAAHVIEAIDKIRNEGKRLAGFISESLLGCGGQIVLPAGYLTSVYREVRNAGGVCIADEVQVGFGRVGSHFWGFQTQGVVPDIVTLGKPIGNGHPLAAVITTPEIAGSFANGMEYFNTYGGNPVSCAVGLAVLDVIEEEQLQANARQVGARLITGLRRLQQQFPLIGDVRGMGLFIGIELVSDPETLTPAAGEAAEIVERMKDAGILISTDGPFRNVLKIKPPLVFNEANADRLVVSLQKILSSEQLSR